MKLSNKNSESVELYEYALLLWNMILKENLLY